MMGRARAVIAVAGFALAIAVVPPLAEAATRAAMPQVGVVAKAGAVTISGDTALKQGPTMFHFSGANKGGKELDLTLFALKAGASQKQLLAESAKLKGPPTPLQKYGTFVIGATVSKQFPTYAVSVSLTKGSYLVVDDTAAPKVVGAFQVGSGSAGATSATPAATITLTDFKITAPATLPTSGTVRFHNDGMSPHFVAMIRTASPANAMKTAMLLHQGKDAKAQKLATGELAPPLGLISPGVTDDVVLSKIPPGSYVLACFYGDASSHDKEHTMLGMETVVTVK
jgi:hypothetical protein